MAARREELREFRCEACGHLQFLYIPPIRRVQIKCKRCGGKVELTQE